jgi:hypothetical protein
LGALKDEYINQKSHPIGNFTFLLSNYMTGLGQMSVIALAIRKSEFTKKYQTGYGAEWFVYAFALAAIFNSVFANASRLSIILTILMFLIPYVTREDEKQNKQRYRNFFLRLLVVGLLIWLAYFMATVFMGGRIGDIDPHLLMWIIGRATFDPFILEFTGNTNTAKTILLQLSYITTGLPTIAYYLNAENWPYILSFGQLNFHIWFETFFRFIPGYDVKNSYMDAYLSMISPLLSAGHFYNLWGSIVRELITDFGLIGTVIFFFLLGYISNKFRFEAIRRNNMETKIILVLLKIQLMWTPLHSLLGHQHFGYVFMLSVSIWIFSKFFSSKTNKSL